MDNEALFAAVDLVGRTGAKELEFGYVHDGVPVEQAGWYAHAQYQGARIMERDQRGPLEAIQALARRLLTGAQCQLCGGLVALDEDGAFAFRKAVLVDGREWNVDQAAATRQCRWRRIGQRWVSGCERGDAAH